MSSAEAGCKLGDGSFEGVTGVVSARHVLGKD